MRSYLNKYHEEAIKQKIEEYKQNEKKDFLKFNFFGFNIYYLILLILSLILSIVSVTQKNPTL
jgi:hypothetical protein